MKSKISSFFHKSSSSSVPKCPYTILFLNEEDDELALWEKKQYQFINTYKRRKPKPNRSEIDVEGSFLETQKKHLKDESCLRSTVVKNKRRSYAQFHLELGQSDFLLHACSTCGFRFAPGEEEDEKQHKVFHKKYTMGIQFKGWCKERLVHKPNIEGGRIILVLDSDSPAHKNKVHEVVKMMEIELGSQWIVHELCKVYLFISSQRIVGCLVAEAIKEAFRVISCSIAGSTDSTKKRERKSQSTSLQFGDICFQMEVSKKAPSRNSSEVSDESVTGAIFCEKEAVAAVCGIRAIWVTPCNRGKHIASHLLDAARKSFCKGVVLERTQIAFSQPTSAGKALASYYTGTETFLVYRTNHHN